MVRAKEKKPTIKKNFFYNLFYQTFLVIIPVITTPYIARVLQSDGVGQYSYSYSIMTYFLLVSNLGFAYYAQREISQSRDDRRKQSIIFWEICILRLVSTLIAGCGLIAFSFLDYFADYRLLLQLLSLVVFANAIDTSFVFMGNENFKQLTIRNVIIKSLMVACIFIFVRNRNDLWLYTLLQGLNPVVSALIMIPFLKHYLVKVSPKEFRFSRHLAPSLRLFIPTIAVSIYTALDKTMIGMLVQGETTVMEEGVAVTKKIADLESGYYNQAEKIVRLFLTVVSALGGVLIPRNAYHYAHGEDEIADKNVMKGFHVALLMAIPLFLGLIAVADNFCPWFFGPGYDRVPAVMRILSGVILAIGLNNVYGYQYLIPAGKDWRYTIAVTCGAVLNLAMNFVLIYYLSAVGAAIASVCAETAILVVMAIMCRKKFSVLQIIKDGWKCIVAGLIMFAPCYVLGLFLSSSIWNTLLIVLVGAVVYVGALLLLRERYAYQSIRVIAKRLKRQRAKSEVISSDDSADSDCGEKSEGTDDGQSN